MVNANKIKNTSSPEGNTDMKKLAIVLGLAALLSLNVPMAMAGGPGEHGCPNNGPITDDEWKARYDNGRSVSPIKSKGEHGAMNSGPLTDEEWKARYEKGTPVHKAQNFGTHGAANYGPITDEEWAQRYNGGKSVGSAY
jgi:hypothetical protein